MREVPHDEHFAAARDREVIADDHPAATVQLRAQPITQPNAAHARGPEYVGRLNPMLSVGRFDNQ